jgi:hypothetical protein
MTTSPTLSKTVNTRAVVELMTGAVGDLAFNRAGHICHRNDDMVINSAVLVRINGGDMLLTAEGADFILENLDGSMSKHDEKALRDFTDASWKAYQAERLVIDQHTDAAKQAAHDVAYALVNHPKDYAAQSLAFQASHDVLADACAALTDAGYRRVVRAFHAHRDEQRDEMRARIEAAR